MKKDRKEELDKLESLKTRKAVYEEMMSATDENGNPVVSETWAKKNILGMSEKEIKDSFK